MRKGPGAGHAGANRANIARMEATRAEAARLKQQQALQRHLQQERAKAAVHHHQHPEHPVQKVDHTHNQVKGHTNPRPLHQEHHEGHGLSTEHHHPRTPLHGKFQYAEHPHRQAQTHQNPVHGNPPIGEPINANTHAPDTHVALRDHRDVNSSGGHNQPSHNAPRQGDHQPEVGIIKHNRGVQHPLTRKFTPPPERQVRKGHKHSKSDPIKSAMEESHPASKTSKQERHLEVPEFVLDGAKAAGTGWIEKGINGIVQSGVDQFKGDSKPTPAENSKQEEPKVASPHTDRLSPRQQPGHIPGISSISPASDFGSFSQLSDAADGETANALFGDQLIFPRSVASCPRVTVSWVHKGKIDSKIYLMFTSWNLNAGQSVLTFIDQSAVSVDQESIRGPFAKIFPDPQYEKQTEYVLVDEQWQWGHLGEQGERFVVYQRHHLPDYKQDLFHERHVAGLRKYTRHALDMFL